MLPAVHHRSSDIKRRHKAEDQWIYHRQQSLDSSVVKFQDHDGSDKDHCHTAGGMKKNRNHDSSEQVSPESFLPYGCICKDGSQHDRKGHMSLKTVIVILHAEEKECDRKERYSLHHTAAGQSGKNAAHQPCDQNINS